MQYSESQKEAIGHIAGPCLVLAGPGSGKTTVITKRTQSLIEEAGVSPGQILVVTFTRAAAGEMQERFMRMTGGRYRSVTFGTFHSIFFAILKHAYHYSASSIIKEDLKYQLLKEIIAKNRIECEDEQEFCSQILGEFSSMKNSGVAEENYYPIHCGKEVYLCMYRQYMDALWTRRLLDFDDILVYTKELLEKREDYRRSWQERFSYLMVDEFQDINQLQYDVVKMLAGAAANLFVVGDDDQSIYRFRGSKPELMLNFPTDFPKAKKISLSWNYRCPVEVTELAAHLIGHNQNRFQKQIESKGIGGKTVYCQEFRDIREETGKLIERIRMHRDQGGTLGQVAVLYRTNMQAQALVAGLMEYNIPFYMKEGLPNIYEHWIAKDIQAYFLLARGENDRKLILRVMNRPNRYISRESVLEPRVDFGQWKDYYQKQYWISERIEQLEYDLKVLSRITPYAAVNYIRKGIGYEEYLVQHAKDRQISADEFLDILEEVQESTRGFDGIDDWMRFVKKYTKEWKEKQENQKSRERVDDAVSIMTLHGAKGLEYDLVFLPQLNEGIVPYKKAVLPAELEEERRMLYVGMTRAKKELHLSHVRMLRNKKAEPSRFLLEATGQEPL